MSKSTVNRDEVPQPTQDQIDTLVNTALGAGDNGATQSLQHLRLVHVARLSQLKRTAASLKQGGASEADVHAAEAAVNTATARIASIGAVHQQATTPAPQVSATGWALYGRILSSSLKPVPHLTVFMTDANKTYQSNFGFSYTDSNGQYLITYAGETDTPRRKATGRATAGASSLQLFIGIVNASGNPIYPEPGKPTPPFTPTPGVATYLDVILPAGEKPVGDPPAFIREIALPKIKKR